MKILKIIPVILLFTITACEKVVNLDLENKSGQLVIEGNISTQSETQIVRITRSVAFTQTNQYPSVSNALVIISDNMGLVDTLKYMSNGQYHTQKLTAGISGRNYQLSVTLDGKTYTAQSRLPELVPLTGLRMVPMAFLGDTIYDVLPEYIDPPSLGNFYGFIVTASSQREIVFETESDNIGNGVANQRDLDIPSSENNPVKIGDTVTVEMRCIDPSIYTYFTSLNQIAGNGPGGGTSPSNPPTNITGGALGYFSAHTKQVRSIIIR